MAKVRLYEITAMVAYSTVVAATSKKDAMKEVESWENAWHANSDLVGVSDVELLDVRDLQGAYFEDEAHIITASAGKKREAAQ